MPQLLEEWDAHLDVADHNIKFFDRRRKLTFDSYHAKCFSRLY